MNSKVNKKISTDISDFSKIMKEAFEPYIKIQEIFKLAYKPFEDLSEILRHQVYVDPITFETLVEILPTVQSKELSAEDVNTNPDIYFVYTNHVKAPKYRNSHIIVDKQTAFLISKLDMAFRHKFYAGITKKPFDKINGVLSIEEHRFEITKGTDVFKLCIMLFGSKQYITKVWNWKDIEDKVIDREKALDSENAFKSKVDRLNKRLEITGYKKIIIFSDKTVRVNPEYIFLFK